MPVNVSSSEAKESLSSVTNERRKMNELPVLQAGGWNKLWLGLAWLHSIDSFAVSNLREEEVE